MHICISKYSHTSVITWLFQVNSYSQKTVMFLVIVALPSLFSLLYPVHVHLPDRSHLASMERVTVSDWLPTKYSVPVSSWRRQNLGAGFPVTWHFIVNAWFSRNLVGYSTITFTVASSGRNAFIRYKALLDLIYLRCIDNSLPTFLRSLCAIVMFLNFKIYFNTIVNDSIQSWWIVLLSIYHVFMLCLWNVCHIGKQRALQEPRSHKLL